MTTGINNYHSHPRGARDHGARRDEDEDDDDD